MCDTNSVLPTLSLPQVGPGTPLLTCIADSLRQAHQLELRDRQSLEDTPDDGAGGIAKTSSGAAADDAEGGGLQDAASNDALAISDTPPGTSSEIDVAKAMP